MSSFTDYTNSEYLVAEALKIDAELAMWVEECPLPYVKTVQLRARAPDVFSDHYHVYTSVWLGTMWNHYRCIRILVNEIILTQLEHQCQRDRYASLQRAPIFYDAIVRAQNAILIGLAHDICASVPYFLGYDPERPGAGPVDPRTRSITGNLLLWPLYMAACTEMVSDVLRTWVAGRFRTIADVMGIRQALPMAYVLSRKEDLIDWQADESNADGLDAAHRSVMPAEIPADVTVYDDADVELLSPPQAEVGLTSHGGSQLDLDLDLDLELELDDSELGFEPCDQSFDNAAVTQGFLLDESLLFDTMV